ncbi:1467_t:CDS:2 [Entrophospora sp. SA101]|nr:1467_t:CDS:2 [Entrophospora sp. SA101]
MCSLNLLCTSERNVQRTLYNPIIIQPETGDDFRTPICSENDNGDSDEDDENNESDEECGLRLDVNEISFDEYIDQGDKHVNISALFKTYQSKASDLSKDSGLLITKNYQERLSLSHILLLRSDNYSEMQMKTFSRETLEDLIKEIKLNFIGKEKVTRDIKLILQEYIEVALDDDDGGLCKLHETITNNFSKTFDSTNEK